MFQASSVPQNFESGDPREVQVDDDDARNRGLTHLRKGLHSLLAIVAALELSVNAFRAQRLLYQENIRVVVFDDKNLGRFA